MIYIPRVLIFSRLVIGFVVICISYFHIPYYNYYAIVALSIGLLTDVFDGIIARKLNISTESLRRLDSSVDQVFFISIALATYIQCPYFFKSNLLKLIVLFGTEGLAYLICFIKFRKEIATHSIGAKMWTLLLFATLVQIIWSCQSNVLFEFCFWIGFITRIEIIAIVLVLRKWMNDVPTVYHAVLLRRGLDIKRNKWFNG